MCGKMALVCIIAIMAALLSCGCSDGHTDEAPPESTGTTEDGSQSGGQPDGNPAISQFMLFKFIDMDELLGDIALVKFTDIEWLERATFGDNDEYVISLVDQSPVRFTTMRDITKLFAPASFDAVHGQELDFIAIPFYHQLPVSYWFSSGDDWAQPAVFYWTGIQTNDVFLPASDGGDFSHGVVWAQHGYKFEASLPGGLTKQEVRAFCDAQPVSAWELQGDAISVLARSTAGVSIYAADGIEIASRPIESSWFYDTLVLSALYRSDDEGRGSLGYWWYVNSRERVNFALEPGTYRFRIECADSDPGLIVRHFADGVLVSSADFSDEIKARGATEFRLTVTDDPGGSVLAFN